jgi:polysaccharide export outer membrane protein
MSSLFALSVVEAVSGQLLPPPEEIVLRPGDAIRLEVKDEPALRGEFTVTVAGQALLPLVGLLPVTERPFSDVRQEITKAYARELVEPVVVATPVLRIAVLGEVRLPGLFPVDPTHTLADLIAAAGGLTPLADHSRISLVRGGTVMEGSIDPQSVALKTRFQSGDQLVVGKQGWARENLPVFIGAFTSVAVAIITGLLLR